MFIMSRPPAMRPLALLAAVLLLAACRTPDEGEPRVAETDSGRGTVSGMNRPADSVAITNRDGSVTMGLAGGQVWMALSDSLRAKIRQDLATDTARAAQDAGGIGGGITRTAKEKAQGGRAARHTPPPPANRPPPPPKARPSFP